MRHMVRVLVGTMLEVAAAGARSTTSGAARRRPARAGGRDRPAARPLPGVGALLSRLVAAARIARSLATSLEADAVSPGRYIDDPVASSDRLAVGVLHVARVIAIVRPAWITSAARSARGRRATGRRKLTFRSRPAIACPRPTVVSTATCIATSASMRDRAALEPAGWAREPLGAGHRDGGRALAGLDRRQPGQVMDRRWRQLAGELAAQDLGAAELDPRPRCSITPSRRGRIAIGVSCSGGSNGSRLGGWLGRGSSGGKIGQARGPVGDQALAVLRSRRPPRARPSDRRGSPARSRVSAPPGRAGRRNVSESSAVV